MGLEKVDPGMVAPEQCKTSPTAQIVLHSPPQPSNHAGEN